MVSNESVVVASSEQVSCDLAGEAVILSLRTGAYHGLDPIAARIWALVQQPSDVASICNTLVSEYDVTAERCAQEVLALLNQLVEWQLIDVVA